MPIAKSDGQSITTVQGFDSPLFRYNLYKYTEGRELGQQRYYVVGWDVVEEAPLASLEGHLGRVDEGTTFSELITSEFYYGRACMLWNLQKTVLSYAEANNSLTGSSSFMPMLKKVVK